MPILSDPNQVLPQKTRRWNPAQVIIALLYPVVFLVGLTVGVVIGIKEGEKNPTNPTPTNTYQVPTKVVPTVNGTVVRNAPDANANQNLNANGNSNANLNANTSLRLQNTNNALSGGDYLKLDATTATQLAQDEQNAKDTLVDQTVSLTDIIRQQDLISLKYSLKAYFAVERRYPSTNGIVIHLDRTDADVLYQGMKAFYGGSFNEKIDPEYPAYYYGYSSDGQTFMLTGYLVSKKKPFILRDAP